MICIIDISHTREDRKYTTSCAAKKKRECDRESVCKCFCICVRVFEERFPVNGL